MLKTRLFLVVLILTLVAALAVPVLGAGASVSGIAFDDGDGNGLMNGKERVMPDLELSLFSVSGDQQNLVKTTVTGVDGSYAFTGLAAGDYVLRAHLPKDYQAAPMVKKGSVLLPGAGRVRQTPVFSLKDNEALDNQFIGATKNSAFVRVVAFGDNNLNGGRFSNEPLLKGAEVVLLYDHEDKTYVVGSATSDKEGDAFIRDVTPGTYRVGVTMPAPYVVGPMGNKISIFFSSIVPTGEAYGESKPFKLLNKGSLGMAVGGAKTGSLTGSVFIDENDNGELDAGERPVEGLALVLKDPKLGFERQVMTGGNGSYQFEKIQPGQYELSVTAPDGLMFSALPGNLVYAATDKTATGKVTLGDEPSKALPRLILMPEAAVVVDSYLDKNVNGVKDADEPAFSGATVTLKVKDAAPLSAQTDSAGIARFQTVPVGEGEVTVSLPDGQVFTVAGADNQFVAKDKAQSELTAAYTAKAGETTTLKAGVTLPGGLQGMLYEDNNSNGNLDSGEKGLSGFTVSAMNRDGQAVATTETDANGLWQLTGLVPAEYRVRIALKTPYIFSQKGQPGGKWPSAIEEQTPFDGDTAYTLVQPGQTMEALGAAAFRSAVLSGRVLKGDEITGFEGQEGLRDVKVELLDEQGAPVSDYTVAVTDAEGRFSLKGALPGTYSLSYTLPFDSAFTKPLLDEESHVTERFSVEASEEKTMPDVFAIPTASIAGDVYMDKGFSGTRDKDAPVVADVRLTATNKATGDIVETISQEDGHYQLAHLRPGTYTFSLKAPQGTVVFHAETSPFAAVAKDSQEAEITVTTGEEQSGRDIALAPVASLQGRVFYDENLSLAHEEGESGFTGASLALRHLVTDELIALTPDENGLVAIDSLLPGQYEISLNLPADQEMLSPQGRPTDGTWQGEITVNGGVNALSVALVKLGSLKGQLWNLGDGPIPEDLSITLTPESPLNKVRSLKVDKEGRYEATGLYPDTYTVSLTLPEELRFARAIDRQRRSSLIVQEEGGTHQNVGTSLPFVLPMADNKVDQDIGFGKPGSLGDFAWLDLNGNGMQDLDEQGMPDIAVTLYQYGQAVATTKTDLYGRYMFLELTPGRYTVEVALHKELKTTKQGVQTLIGSVLPAGQSDTVKVDDILVPSGGRNFNCDFGFVLKDGKTRPAVMQMIPVKDWTPLP